MAYVTPETADEAALMAAARSKLPAYMVPSAIVKLAELPRLASGKVRWEQAVCYWLIVLYKL